MSLKEEIAKKTKEIAISSIEWDETFENIPGKKNPYLMDGNGIKITVAALNLDLRGYKKMQSENRNKNIARILRAYFVTASSIIKENGGKVIGTAGDGILALFNGITKQEACDKAITSAMSIKYMLITDENNDSLNNVFKSYNCSIDFGAGVDYGDVNVVKVDLGLEDNSAKDIVWIGECINTSVKVSDKCAKDKNIGITEGVYEITKYRKDKNSNNIWQNQNGIYKTSYHITMN